MLFKFHFIYFFLWEWNTKYSSLRRCQKHQASSSCRGGGLLRIFFWVMVSRALESVIRLRWRPMMMLERGFSVEIWCFVISCQWGEENQSIFIISCDSQSDDEHIWTRFLVIFFSRWSHSTFHIRLTSSSFGLEMESIFHWRESPPSHVTTIVTLLSCCRPHTVESRHMWDKVFLLLRILSTGISSRFHTKNLCYDVISLLTLRASRLERERHGAAQGQNEEKWKCNWDPSETGDSSSIIPSPTQRWASAHQASKAKKHTKIWKSLPIGKTTAHIEPIWCCCCCWRTMNGGAQTTKLHTSSRVWLWLHQWKSEAWCIHWNTLISSLLLDKGRKAKSPMESVANDRRRTWGLGGGLHTR